MTFPEGGNNAFMGYLQKYYKGEEQAIDITENISIQETMVQESHLQQMGIKIESPSFNNL